jgi:hypothetical protein
VVAVVVVDSAVIGLLKCYRSTLRHTLAWMQYQKTRLTA